MSRNKQKGTAFETLVVRWLAENGFPYAERRALAGTHDCGDVTGIPGLVIECKTTKPCRSRSGWKKLLWNVLMLLLIMASL